MTKLQIRTVIYAATAGLQTLVLGINEGAMTVRDVVQLIASSLLAAIIAVRALYDTAPDNSPTPSATATTEDVDRSRSTSATGGVGDLSKRETKRVEVVGANESGQTNFTEGK